ncbi:MAG TPA: oligosaccharide flippase family protein [Polyangiaceae bacterium]|nr:oligosaccharide flippase family protein [Polyangiaceae bacterium]
MSAPAKQGQVFRNTLILVGAQLLGTPLTIVLNAAMGRYLGAERLGDVYLASTLMGFGFLFVEWGQGGVLPAAVAQNRSRAGVLLGSSLAWRFWMSIIVSVLLVLGCRVFGYTASFQLILAIVGGQWLLMMLSNAIQEMVRGFERTDVSALGKLGAQILAVLFVIPALVMGGSVVQVLLVQVATQAAMLVWVWRARRRVGELDVTFDWQETKALVRSGHAFLAFNFAMALQGNVDAIFLSKLSTSEVMGWHSAAQRLSGTLNIPASALVASLYPTLARLLVEDMDAFRETARQALRGTTLLAVPLALCCAIYRDVGIALYGKEGYGPAGQNLLILSGLLFLVYFSMPLGTTVIAAGRQRAWAIAQASCVLVSFGLDPFLIPYFQKAYGNGGLGVCVGAVTSEVFMVTVALFLVPKGVVDHTVAKVAGKAALSGAVMVGVAYLLHTITPFVAAPIALAAYFGVLWLVGGIDPKQIEAVKSKLGSRFKRAK